jgi:hypothetical protein
MSKKLLSCLLAALAIGPAAFAITYTGDVASDFVAAGGITVADGANDVGLPYNAPVMTVSGWDLDYSAFELDRGTGELHVGLDFFGFGGDADGDGLDGITSLWLAGNGGFDLPALALTESICIAFDFDQNGTYDVIAGMGGMDGTYRVSTFVGSPILPAFGFGPLSGNDGGHFYGPDMELTVNSLGDFEDLDRTSELCFNFLVFAGSYQDDGIGEDLQSGTVCFPPDELVGAVTPATMNLVSAYPNPFNPTTTLAVELAQTGNVELSVYNVQGQLVQTLVNGMLESGHHELSFDASALPSGLYLAKMATSQGTTVTRLTLTK